MIEPETTAPHDVHTLIVGGGPAGAAAGITLARNGHRVVIVDKASFPRDKCCGDGLTTGALRLLEHLGLDPAEVPSWKPIRTVHVAGPTRTTVRFQLPAGPGQYAAIARRSELDHALLRRAETVGVDVREGVTLNGITATERSVLARTSAGDYRARHLIAADGMWSTTRKLLDLGSPGYRGEWHAFRQYFTNVSPRAQDELFVWFERDLLPGYVWAFPLADGTANVGFGIRRGHGIGVQEMKALWADLLARPRIAEVLGPDAVALGRHTAWPIPARLGRLPVRNGRVMFVGDAAAATDPMTGEGIGQAIETGIWAAEAIHAHGEDVDAAGTSYDERLRRTMQKDHRLAGRLSGLLAHPHLAEAALRTAGASSWTRRNFVRWLFEDYPRAVLLTPTRWHTRLFSQPGAYIGNGEGGTPRSVVEIHDENASRTWPVT